MDKELPDWKARPADVDKAGQPGHDSRGRPLKSGTVPIDAQIDFARNGMNNSKKALQRRILGTERLSGRQEKFAVNMASQKFDSAAEAARDAGFSEKHASSVACRLMKTPKVKARIESLMAEAGRRNDVTIDEVIQKLRDVYDGALAMGHFQAANKAAENLGRYLGLFESRQIQGQILGHLPLTSGDDHADASRLAKIARLAKEMQNDE